MELPKRKPNRIADYDYGLNGAYFVTVCTKDRAQTLSKIVGDGFPVPTALGKIAQSLIEELPRKYPGVSVDNYVIMPDHIHLLLMIDKSGTGDPSPTLGSVIGWYKYQTTKRWNLQWGTPSEAIFQRSYYDHVIRNRQDYDETWNYIEANPCNWVMTKQDR